MTTHATSAALVLCGRRRPTDDEKQDGKRTHNCLGHGALPGGGFVDGGLTPIYTSTREVATAGTASRSRGTASTVLAGTFHVYRLWTVTLPVGPAT